MSARPPRFSVIVAAYQSDEVISGCLEAIRAQTARDFEVIVVNSSPRDRTAAIVLRDFPEVRLIGSTTRLLPHAARNVGVAHAHGELLVFTDADCRPAPDWLERLGRCVEGGREVICGSIDLEGAGYFALGVHLCKYSFRSPQRSAGPCKIAGTANACYSRKAWEAVGPFDGSRFSGDAILSLRADAAGLEPWFAPEARVAHRYEPDFAGFLRERIERGRDFADARMAMEGWSRLRSACYAAAFPLLPFVPLVRTATHRLPLRWAWAYVATWPLQFAGHFAWSAGELPRHLRAVLAPPPAPASLGSET